MDEQRLRCPECQDDTQLHLLVSLTSEVQVPASIEPELLRLLAGREWEREDRLACGTCGHSGEIESFVSVLEVAPDVSKVIVLRNRSRRRRRR